MKTLVIDLILTTLFRPLQQTYRQTDRHTHTQTEKYVSEANSAKEGTMKHNYSLSLQASSLSLSLSLSDLQPKLEVHTKTAENLLKH